MNVIFVGSFLGAKAYIIIIIIIITTKAYFRMY